jgi:hypothetical protein
MNLSCAQVEERLSDYLDRTLTSGEEATFLAHLDGCPECSRLALDVQELTMRMPRLAPVVEPADLESKILRATLGEHRAWRGWFGWISAIWQPQFAIGVATAAVSFMIAFHALGLRMQGLTATDLTSASMTRTANRQVHLLYARGAKFVNDLWLVYEIQSRFSAPQAASSGESNTPRSESQPKTDLNPRGNGSVGASFAQALGETFASAERSYR